MDLNTAIIVHRTHQKQYLWVYFKPCLEHILVASKNKIIKMEARELSTSNMVLWYISPPEHREKTLWRWCLKMVSVIKHRALSAWTERSASQEEAINLQAKLDPCPLKRVTFGRVTIMWKKGKAWNP